MEQDTTAMVIAERPSALAPKEILAQGSDQATALADFIEKKKLYSNIQGRKYVRVEGWVPLARMNGVIPREVSNEQFPDGHFVARVQLVRLSDGGILTEASGECGGPDEPMWQGRPPYARRSMAATRATGKACRLAYSWVMALSGYEPTPAEEMDNLPHVNHRSAPEPSDDSPLVPFGKNKGMKVSDLAHRQVQWYLDYAKKRLPEARDPEGELRWIAALEDELAMREKAQPIEAEAIPDSDTPF